MGDDIAWIKPDANGRLRAINPEAGFFGVAPGTSVKTNPNAMATLARNTHLHQCRADARRRRVVGRHDRRAAGRMSGLAAATCGRRRSPRKPAPRPRIPTRASPRRRRNARPSIRPGKIPTACRSARSSSADAARPPCRWFTRRSTGARAFISARPWARRRRRRRRAAVGKVRRDPMAMLPFCGYHMGDYFRHWIKMQRSLTETPRIFHVNWFRKDADGKFIWPGFSENMRVLKWIVDRAHGRALGGRRPSAGCRAMRTSTGRG